MTGMRSRSQRMSGRAVGLKGKLGNRRAPPDHQATISLPGQPGKVQEKLDRWTAGAAEYEAERQRWRIKPHRFVPMGTSGRDECEKCGAPRNEILTIKGRKVPLHREPIPPGKRKSPA